MEPKDYAWPFITDSESAAIINPQYTARIKIGGWIIMLRDKTFTPEQIEHIRDFFGFEVENICE